MPDLVTLDLVTLDEQIMPRMTDCQRWLGAVENSTMPIPHDCTDGFLYAYWRWPQAYLDPRIRAAMSSFWALGTSSVGLEKQARDLGSGAWETRYSDLLNHDGCDAGYRLVTVVDPESQLLSLGAVDNKLN